MTVCPIAIAVSCKKCPLFSICPAKSILGDQRAATADSGKSAADSPKAETK